MYLEAYPPDVAEGARDCRHGELSCVGRAIVPVEFDVVVLRYRRNQ
jgi:hypothetical protein